MEKSELKLVELTSEDAKRQCKENDYEEWGAPFYTLNEYHEKERILRNSLFCKNTIYFALISSTDQILCHCEAHRFDCVRCFKSDRQSTDVLIEGHSYHIASVHTLRIHRRRGFAAHFLQLILSNLRNRQNVIASALYSDINPAFYERLGWRYKEYASGIAVIDVQLLQTCDLEQVEMRGNAIFLDHTLDQILEADVQLVKQRLKSDPKMCDKDIFFVIPTREIVQWHAIPGQYIAETRKLSDRQRTYGYIIHDEAFILWSHDIKSSTLYILRARLNCELEILLELLRKAIAEAKSYNLRYVKMWQPPTVLFEPNVQQCIPIQKCTRKDSIPCLILFDSAAATSMRDCVDKLWLLNEKFAWV